MRAQLIPTDGRPPIEIDKDLVLVGRREECDLRLDHKSVSKLHCIIVKTDGLLLLRDLGSTNGTRVNGQRVRRAALLPNDQLSIASCKFRVYLGPDEAAAPVRQDDRTQHLDANDMANMLRTGKKSAATDSSDEMPALPMNPNALPDVYPEDDTERRSA